MSSAILARTVAALFHHELSTHERFWPSEVYSFIIGTATCKRGTSDGKLVSGARPHAVTRQRAVNTANTNEVRLLTHIQTPAVALSTRKPLFQATQCVSRD